MNTKTKEKLLSQLLELPNELFGQPATDEDIHLFEQQFGPIPESYKWVLKNCGKMIIGSDFTDDIIQLSESHKKFNAEKLIGNGWTLKDIFLIGWDGAGNPIGIEIQSGHILIEYIGDAKTTVLLNSIDEIAKP
ncbi:MAG: SMI1/KNR4 family protein [Lentisphaeria bacterium]|nr:SMI1/KNR4 family protein [Lentisphaeria bacterium]NQZ70251.1 SMI1/KNR4 family protein [Lentisphaeria bacterium]